MGAEITVPRFGWNMESGVFRGWLKKDGEQVRSGDALFSLEGDKAVQDVDAIDDGVLRIPADGPKDGDTLAVGAVIGFLEGATQSGTTLRVVKDAQSAPVQSGTTLRVVKEANRDTQSATLGERLQDAERRGTMKPASPAVRRLARERGVDLDSITGSGVGGRIDAGDLAHPSLAIQAPMHLKSTPRARRLARMRGVELDGVRGTGSGGRIRERDVIALAAGETLSPMRKTIAERLSKTWQTAVPVTLHSSADVTELVYHRDGLKNINPENAPTFTDFFISLVAQSLKEHPAINARWSGERLDVRSEVHIGLAVDTTAGLMVPVIRDADKLKPSEIAERTRDLANRARSRSLQAQDMQGGTFTISNLGKFGIDTFTPILNSPEIAILGIGRIQRRPAVVGNQIAIRDVVSLSLTFDHRAIDGAPAAAFLQTVVKSMEAWR